MIRILGCISGSTSRFLVEGGGQGGSQVDRENEEEKAAQRLGVSPLT